MISERKLAANRRNAQKSSGPRTQSGKAASRMNAMKHGMTAEQVILDGESAKQFKALRRDLFDALDPADAIEAELVEAIVMDRWRLRRHYRAEASLFTELGGGESLGGAFQAAPQSVTILIRYHAGIQRSIHHNMAALERCQARRRGEAVSAPMSVIVTGPDEPCAAESAVAADAPPVRQSNPQQPSMTYPPPADKGITIDPVGTRSPALGDVAPHQRICETNPPKLPAPASICRPNGSATVTIPSPAQRRADMEADEPGGTGDEDGHAPRYNPAEAGNHLRRRSCDARLARMRRLA
jgi:hypothetical protein